MTAGSATEFVSAVIDRRYNLKNSNLPSNPFNS